LDWLEGKVISHTGRKVGNPKDRTTLSNYLKGFYALDLFKANGCKYSDTDLSRKITIPINSEIELDQGTNSLHSDKFKKNLLKNSLSIFVFQSPILFTIYR
jgi:hypothetical protein